MSCDVLDGSGKSQFPVENRFKINDKNRNYETNPFENNKAQVEQHSVMLKITRK